MSRSIIFLIIAIVVIAGAWFFFRGNSEPLPSPAAPPVNAGNPPAPTGATVRYTNSGYEPRELRITAGETVTFINESDDTVWTASAPHPAHTNYPGFDELKASNPGESYSFTFTETGAWRYHNHVNPGQMGSIIVE